jgi:hypothetical protein
MHVQSRLQLRGYALWVPGTALCCLTQSPSSHCHLSGALQQQEQQRLQLLADGVAPVLPVATSSTTSSNINITSSSSGSSSSSSGVRQGCSQWK